MIMIVEMASVIIIVSVIANVIRTQNVKRIKIVEMASVIIIASVIVLNLHQQQQLQPLPPPLPDQVYIYTNIGIIRCTLGVATDDLAVKPYIPHKSLLQ